MKKILVVLACVALLTFSIAMAQEPVKTIVTVGGSYWNAQYTLQDEDGKELYDFGTGNLFGPYLSLSHGKWNFGASMYFGKFPVEETGLSDMSRNDLNFSLGYRVHPNINIFGGVKYLTWTMELEGMNYYGNAYTVKNTAKTPMFGAGVGGTVPLGTSGLYAFGSVAYLVGNITTESDVSGLDYDVNLSDGSSEDTSAQLVALNLGLGYRFASGLGINLGYRADLYTESTDYKDEFGDTATAENDFGVKGIVATISYTFK